LLSPMKWPALLLTFIMLFVVLAIALNANTEVEETYLVPSLVGFLFFLTLYALIANFEDVPRKVDPGDRFVLRLKIRLYRCWFSVLGVLFFLAVGASLLFTVKLLRLWVGG
jgi:hypothetical protein